MRRLYTGRDFARLGSVILVVALVLLAQIAGARGVVTAPDFSLHALNGERYSKAALRGQPVLLIFWAPWCRVCQNELPVLSRFAEGEKPGQLRVVSVGFADSRANVEEFVKAHQSAFAFPAAYDDDNAVARAYRVTATPTSVVINERGDVVLVHRGAGLL